MRQGGRGEEKGGVPTNNCHDLYSMPDVAAACDVNLLSELQYGKQHLAQRSRCILTFIHSGLTHRSDNSTDVFIKPL